MEYALDIEGAPATIPGGTGLLLVHPSTAETDRIDTAFLGDDDEVLVISTRTTAREVRQKLEYYDVEEERATILDTLSVERGYTRRPGEGVRYVSAPDDIEGVVDSAREWLADGAAGRRLTLDSVTELIYYADEDRVRAGLEELLDLLDEHDAVGLFHMAAGVHGDDTVEAFASRCDGVIELSEGGNVSVDI
jgi:KaiC/GvpD/RAD55 family RecA-like ATPase